MHLREDVKHILVTAAEVYPDAGLVEEEDNVNGEAQWLQDIERARSTKSAVLDNLRVNSIFRPMEKKALKAKTFLDGRQTLV